MGLTLLRGAVRIAGADGNVALVVDEAGIPAVAVADLMLRDLTRDLLNEMRLIRFHLEQVTEENVKAEDLGDR